MTAVTVSVVIVSRGRAQSLLRCLSAVAQLLYAPFEVVVVADPEGCEAVSQSRFARHVKLTPFDLPNIARARNVGVSHSAGEVVAFIDDDAVPEPLWLHHLAGAFADPDTVCAGGYVIARNGISFQWRGRSVDREGRHAPLDHQGDAPVLLSPQGGRAIRTEGTNMAIRRDVIAEMGGFDPVYRYFMDDTDLNMRLAIAGHRTAIVPLAQVHHGFAANEVRGADRVPRDLQRIGAGWALFLNKYCHEARIPVIRSEVEAQERARALRHMVRGGLEPRAVRHLIAGLRAGFAEGTATPPAPMPPLARDARGLRPFPTRPGAAQIALAGRPAAMRALTRRATEVARDGQIPTVLILSRTTLFHRVAYDPRGFWIQQGGQFGRSERNAPLLSWRGFGARVREELARTQGIRGNPLAAEHYPENIHENSIPEA